MAKPVSKRFSNVRYWRYVFTPLLFLVFVIGVILLYTSDVAKGTRLEGPESLVKRTGTLASLLGELDKLRR
jgi:hypothetical protein